MPKIGHEQSASCSDTKTAGMSPQQPVPSRTVADDALLQFQLIFPKVEIDPSNRRISNERFVPNGGFVRLGTPHFKTHAPTQAVGNPRLVALLRNVEGRVSFDQTIGHAGARKLNTSTEVNSINGL